MSDLFFVCGCFHHTFNQQLRLIELHMLSELLLFEPCWFFQRGAMVIQHRIPTLFKGIVKKKNDVSVCQDATPPKVHDAGMLFTHRFKEKSMKIYRI